MVQERRILVEPTGAGGGPHTALAPVPSEGSASLSRPQARLPFLVSCPTPMREPWTNSMQKERGLSRGLLRSRPHLLRTPLHPVSRSPSLPSSCLLPREIRSRTRRHFLQDVPAANCHTARIVSPSQHTLVAESLTGHLPCEAVSSWREPAVFSLLSSASPVRGGGPDT